MGQLVGGSRFLDVLARPVSEVRPVTPRCGDCLAIGARYPRERDGKSTRCRDHRELHDKYMAQGRNRRARANKAGRAFATEEEWAGAYRPQPLPTPGRLGALIDPGHLAQIHAALDDVKDALLAADNARELADTAIADGRTGEPELRAGLRNLRQTVYDAVTVLDEIPGIRPIKPR